MAKLLKTTGEIIDITPKNGTNFEENELKQIVGGEYESFSADTGQWVVFLQDARLTDLPKNRLASAIYETALYGPVLCCNLVEASLL